ncbi:flavin monoamine oxidase family protein [Colwelliaceae bacterium BS250]
MNTHTVIIGAGLSGLYAASLLEKQGVDYIVIEARPRIGGRILSSSIIDNVSNNNDINNTRSCDGLFDLGPSWFWPQQNPKFSQLIQQLNLSSFKQHETGDYLFQRAQNTPIERYKQEQIPSQGSMRVNGGMQAVVDKLSQKIPINRLRLNTKVFQIEYSDQTELNRVHITNENNQQVIEASNVIFALPHRLLAESITLIPDLPVDIKNNFLKKPTWMAAHAKFTAVYEQPFWYDNNLSGSASSQVGPLVEIHDATTPSGQGALFGFVGIDAQTRQQIGLDEVKQAALKQLVDLFGEQGQNPLAVELIDWSQEAFTATKADKNAPSDHPNYGLPKGVERLHAHGWYFSGTESAHHNGGYLEGALEASKNAIQAMNIQ